MVEVVSTFRFHSCNMVYIYNSLLKAGVCGLKIYIRVTVIDLFVFFSVQEHTDWIGGVKFDDFQVISCSDRTLFVYDFLDPTPPSLGARPLNGPFGEVWFPHHTLRLPS